MLDVTLHYWLQANRKGVIDVSLFSKLSQRFSTKLVKSSPHRIVLVTAPSSIVPFYSSTATQTKTSQVPTIPMLPLGIAYVAAALEKAHWDVKVVDLTFTMENQLDVVKIKNAITRLQPKIIGLSSFTSTILSIYKIANACKRDRPDIPIVLGGPHATALPNRTLLECPGLDAVIVGEGESSFPQFAEAWVANHPPQQLATIPGVVIKDRGQVLGNSKPVYVSDLNTLLFPARHLFNRAQYADASHYFDAKSPPVTSVITSRGCPHACLYCARVSSGYKFRTRSPENIVTELRDLKNQGYNEIQIVDDDFTEDRNHVLNLCQCIKNDKLNLQFNLLGGLRVDKVDEELLTRIYDVGGYMIHFGAESGDDAVLKYNRKGITAKEIVDAVHLAKKIGFSVIIYIIIGLPGSSLDSEKKTLAMINQCAPDGTRASVCTPYPGSPLWEQMKDQLQNITWDRFNESDISHPAYMTDQVKTQLQFWMDMVGVTIS
ncbi:MAG: B12-binding domain-containing radical SAM protein [Candidatus Bathyarchaeota archaeon]|nr:B12-binding domain-containing radical SAM protein [Candidatus Bathyarchaeota archaeon]